MLEEDNKNLKVFKIHYGDVYIYKNIKESEYSDLDVLYGNLYVLNSTHEDLSNFPRIIYGECVIDNDQITRIFNSPKEVYGDFNVRNCKNLKEFSDFPKCHSNIDISNNSLTCLDNIQKEIKGNFNCSDNNLTSLDNGPEKVYGRYDASNNFYLKCINHLKFVESMLILNNTSIEFLKNEKLDCSSIIIMDNGFLNKISLNPNIFIKINCFNSNLNTVHDITDRIFIMSNSKNILFEKEYLSSKYKTSDFFTGLYNYMINNNLDVYTYKYWPDNFEELKKLAKNTNKFNL